MPTQQPHIKHKNKRIFLLLVLLCVMLCTNAKAQEADTIKSEYLGKQGTPLSADNFDTDKIDSDKAIVSFEKGAGKYAFDKFDIKFSGRVRIRDKYTKIDDYRIA